ncbi:MAG TPA: C4-type zinc ribbon domain-containing protein [bacterium]|nr:C4-type zinc ribbon domain-containing protein [bacterium]
MLEDLRILILIQEKDVKIRDIERRKVEQPRYFEELKQGFALKQKNLETLKEQLKKCEAERKTLELDVEAKQASAQKYEGQLFQVKTNVEYKALENEIKNIKQEARNVEDRIIEAMEKVEAVRKKIADEEKYLAGEKDKVLIEEQRCKDELVKEERVLEELRAQRQELAGKVGRDAYERYTLLFENKDDAAVVPILHGACNGCLMQLTAQVINEVKRSTELVICENCARILYYSAGK